MVEHDMYVLYDIDDETTYNHFLGLRAWCDSESLHILQVLSFDPVIIVSPS